MASVSIDDVRDVINVGSAEISDSKITKMIKRAEVTLELETDKELHSDNECLLRAKALYDYLSSPAEYIKVTSDVIDYGTTPVLAGDRIWVTLPNKNINGYYRVISVEYYLRARDQTLEATLELGKEPMLLADYLYALRSKTGSLARYKIGRI